MNDCKTIFVVGAGSSHEYGLPLGRGLANVISKLLSFHFERGRLARGDDMLFHAIRVVSEKQSSDLLRCAKLIAGAMPLAMSIDNYVDTLRGEPGIAICAKLAIMKAILDAERQSQLRVDPSNKYNTVQWHAVTDKWMTKLFGLIQENCSFVELPNRLSSIGFVIFNYDRCVEHFLYYAIRQIYGVDDSRAARVLSSVRFWHPYGSIGLLPWQSHDEGLDFGIVADSVALAKATENIRTFTERHDKEDTTIAEIRTSIANASTVVFLGFAYHKQNVELLSDANQAVSERKSKTVLGTAVGMSDNDAHLIKLELGQRLSPRLIEIRKGLECSQLFSEYTKTLSIR